MRPLRLWLTPSSASLCRATATPTHDVTPPVPTPAQVIHARATDVHRSKDLPVPCNLLVANGLLDDGEALPVAERHARDQRCRTLAGPARLHACLPEPQQQAPLG